MKGRFLFVNFLMVLALIAALEADNGSMGNGSADNGSFFNDSSNSTGIVQNNTNESQNVFVGESKIPDANNALPERGRNLNYSFNIMQADNLQNSIYFKRNVNIDPYNEAVWPWVQILPETEKNQLFIDLTAFTDYIKENPGYRVFLSPLDNAQSGRQGIIFNYFPQFSADGCMMQFGTEIMFDDGTSDTTWTLDLGEHEIISPGNYDVILSKLENGWTEVRAVSIEEVPAERIIMLYISLPSGCVGNVFIGNVSIWSEAKT